MWGAHLEMRRSFPQNGLGSALQGVPGGPSPTSHDRCPRRAPPVRMNSGSLATAAPHADPGSAAGAERPGRISGNGSGEPAGVEIARYGSREQAAVSRLSRHRRAEALFQGRRQRTGRCRRCPSRRRKPGWYHRALLGGSLRGPSATRRPGGRPADCDRSLSVWRVPPIHGRALHRRARAPRQAHLRAALHHPGWRSIIVI